MVSSTPHQGQHGYLLDSGIFITARRRGLDLDELVKRDPHLTYGMSAITAAELLIGVDLATPGRRAMRQQMVEDYFADFAVLDFDIPCARRWARLASAVHSQGLLIGAHDLLIAATALHHNFAVITYNTRKFSRVPGLTVIPPSGT